MKKIILKTFLLALLICLFTLGFYLKSVLFFRDAVSHQVFAMGKPCAYYDRIPDNEESDLPANRCLFEGGETGYEFPPDVDAFVSQIIEKEYPGYQRVDSWISIVETAYSVVNLKSIAARPMVKAVWLCSSPETQVLTTHSSVFSLCTATPNVRGNGYESSVRFYEFVKSGSGYASRRIYEESARAQEDGTTSVLISVEFSLFSGKLLAQIEKHFLNGETEVKNFSNMLVYREGIFNPLFEFVSFLSDENSALCGDTNGVACQPLRRWLQMPDDILAEGDTVFLVEGRGKGGYFRDATKEIPFIFDAKNWTLKRKFPRKPGETF